MKSRILLLVFVLITGSLAAARESVSSGIGEPGKGKPGGTVRISLSELAAAADMVAVAQVKDTDYIYARSYPNEGSAFLKILITYKRKLPAEEIIEVYEKGLHPYECYFENPTVLEEGRRYLVFLRLDPEDPERYRGFAQGCALEILVTRDNRYALKYPVNGIAVEERLDELASAYEFRDNYALVSKETLPVDERNALLANGMIIPYQDKYKYTHGIDLTTARSLIAPESLRP